MHLKRVLCVSSIPFLIGYSGIESPIIVLALSDEGVQRRQYIFASLKPDTFILKEKSVSIPDTKAHVVEIDFRKLIIEKTPLGLTINGTAGVVVATHHLGVLPTKNWQQGTFDGWDSIQGEKLTEKKIKCGANRYFTIFKCCHWS